MLLKRRVLDSISSKWMVICLVIILLLPLLIALGLAVKAMPLIEGRSVVGLLFSNIWSPLKGEFGFWPFISGSIYVTILSFILSAPVCLLAALYLTQFSAKRMMRIMHPIIDVLSGLPSVVYGVWGVLVVVPMVSDYLAPAFNTVSSGYSILSAGIVLSIMCVPYMLNMLIELFSTVPVGLKEAPLSLGATYWEAIKLVVLRKNLPGIFSAFGLSIAKAFGETIAVMMVVGNQIQAHLNPFKGGYPLPALIANNYGEMLSIPLYDSALMFAALLLFLIILIINMIFRYIIYYTQKG